MCSPLLCRWELFGDFYLPTILMRLLKQRRCFLSYCLNVCRQILLFNGSVVLLQLWASSLCNISKESHSWSGFTNSNLLFNTWVLADNMSALSDWTCGAASLKQNSDAAPGMNHGTSAGHLPMFFWSQLPNDFSTQSGRCGLINGCFHLLYNWGRNKNTEKLWTCFALEDIKRCFNNSSAALEPHWLSCTCVNTQIL